MDSLRRILSVVRVDFLVRFRRTSTAVIFLLLCIAAYLWIPDPSTGRALLQFEKQRAVYNSAALGMATASLCNILLGLIGFYMVSNSITRDVRTRTGFVMAATTVRNLEYLIAKTLGNSVFLGAVIAGFMLSGMGMQMLRGEAPLQPLVFMYQYLLLVPPILVFVPVIAVVFESVRFLSGRFGDLAYFFVWMMLLVMQAAGGESKEFGWMRFLDVYGFRFMLEHVKWVTGSDSVAIGSSEFDATKPLYVFNGLSISRGWLLPRIVSTFFPIPMLLIALAGFHRFDPARLKVSAGKVHGRLLEKVNRILKPVTVRLLQIENLWRGRSGRNREPSFLSRLLIEVFMILKLKPAALFLLLGSLIISLLVPYQRLAGVLPVLFAVLTAMIADISTRERLSGTTSMVHALPHLKKQFVLWKFGASLILVLTFCSVAIARICAGDISAGVTLIIGCVFLASCATTLGILSANPKTMIVLFLLFLYLVVNSGGKPAWFDFMGMFGTATAGVRLGYFILSAIAVLAASRFYRYRTQKI